MIAVTKCILSSVLNVLGSVFKFLMYVFKAFQPAVNLTNIYLLYMSCGLSYVQPNFISVHLTLIVI